MKKSMIKQCILSLLCLLWAGQTVLAGELRERVYLQTDKQFYLSGELVWMKFIATDLDQRLSDVSKVGYVELLDSASAVVQARLVLEKGVGNGCLQLPSTLPTGNYRLVAYTRYMRNEGEEVFFEKPLAVVNTFVTNETLLTDTLLPAYSFTRREGPVSVSPDRMTYDTRSGGEIRINGLPPDLQTLSVSIAGIDLYKPSARSGIVDWKQNMPTTGSSPADRKFLAEYEGPILTGKVIDLSTGECSSKEAVSPLLAFSGGEIRLFGGQLGAAGEVTFFTKHISGTHEIVTVALSPSSSRYRVDIESPYATHPEKELPALRLNPAWQDELVKRSVGLQVLHAYRSDSLVREKAEKPWFQWQPDWSYLLDEYTRFTTMEEVVIEFIPGLRFRKMDGVRRLAVLTEERIGYTIGNSLVLLDGIPITDHEIIFKYDPLKIRKIDVYKGKYVFGGQIFDGIASFSSYEHNYPGLVVDNSTQFFDYEGTQAQRIFYMPAYRTEAEKRSPVPDFRHTLLWRPDIRTAGESFISIPFTTSDLTGDFTITIEGLTQTGEALYATEQFQVK